MSATPYYSDAAITLHEGDCLEVLRRLPDASVDAVVTDPPYGLGFMGREWDNLPPGLPWAQECLRVLKPGGHLLAFGGTRTWHRLACAVEDAGFEVRDSIAWMYGSGFPKSLDVSKAIDKQRTEDLAPAAAVAKWLVDHMETLGITRRDVCDHFSAENIAQQWTTHWTDGAVKPRVPKWEQWVELRAWLDLPGDMDAEVWRLNGRKGKPGDNFEAREVLSERVAVVEGGSGGWSDLVASGRFKPGEKVIRETAPATDDARTWQGWGTALKPAFEPIVVARKPLASPGINVLAVVESGLRECGIEGEIQWTSGPVSGAAKPDPQTSSSSTGAPPAAETSAAPVAASETPSVERPTASGSATSTPHGERPTASTSAPTHAARQPNSEPKSSPPTATPAPAVTSESPTSSPSTTSTEAEPPTARRPGGRSTTKSSAKDSRPVIESFAGIATGLSGSWATVRIDRLADGTCVWPDGLPRDTAGRSTVAANVLAHGTGALNIDGCRIEGPKPDTTRGASVNASSMAGELGAQGRILDDGRGRWPANVILDESQADALDEQSGASQSRVGKPRGADHGEGWGMTATGAEYDDQGGASRFFYVAKADQSERVRVDGVAHPTVKPLDIMRWLVRLVTPPGGTVLEPFAGSGTTVEACILEGFQCIAIEREADYLPLIAQRINRRRDPVAAVKALGDDGGLFDLLDGGAA